MDRSCVYSGKPMMPLAMPGVNDIPNPLDFVTMNHAGGSSSSARSGITRISSSGSLHSHRDVLSDDDEEHELLSHPSLGSMGSMTHLLRHVPDAKERDRRAKTKDRVVQMHKDEVERRHQELIAKEARNEEKKKAREEHAIVVSRGAAWAPIIAFLITARAWPLQRARAERRQVLAEIYGPFMYIRARRLLRTVRARLALPDCTKPTISALRADRMLNLFTDSHLKHLIYYMTLRYYFPNETIVFGGCGEEDECFCLCRGTADVMVNGQCVFTLTAPNAVFGSIGMISGEPRTATVAARGEEGALVWVATRDRFEEYEQLHGATGATADSHRIINELRISNFRSVFQKQLQGAHMRAHFVSLLQGIDVDFISRLATGSTPLIVNGDATLVRPGLMDRNAMVALVLRGKLVVRVKRGTTLPLNITPEEMVRTSFVTTAATSAALGPLVTTLRNLQEKATPYREEQASVGISSSHLFAASAPTQPVTTSTARFLVTHDVVLGEISAPVIVNAPLMVFPDTPLYFQVDAGPRGCDLLTLPRDVILQQDLLELDKLRQNIKDLYANLMRPLSAKQVLRAVLHDVRKLLPVLRHVSSGELPAMTPVVLRTGDTLNVSAEQDHAYLLVSGELETSGANVLRPYDNSPTLWPPLAVSYFGGAASQCRAVARVDLFRVDRKELAVFVKTQCETVNAAVLPTLTTSLQDRYLVLTGRHEPSIRAAMKAAALEEAARAAAARTAAREAALLAQEKESTVKLGIAVFSEVEDQPPTDGSDTRQNHESILGSVALDSDADALALYPSSSMPRTDSNFGRRYTSSRDHHGSSVSSYDSILSSPALGQIHTTTTATSIEDRMAEYDLLKSMGSLGSGGTDMKTYLSNASDHSMMPTSPTDRTSRNAYVRRPQSRSPGHQYPPTSPQTTRSQGHTLESIRSPVHSSLSSPNIKSPFDRGIAHVASPPKSFSRPNTRDGGAGRNGSPRPPAGPAPTKSHGQVHPRGAPPVVGKTAPTFRRTNS